MSLEKLEVGDIFPLPRKKTTSLKVERIAKHPDDYQIEVRYLKTQGCRTTHVSCTINEFRDQVRRANVGKHDDPHVDYVYYSARQSCPITVLRSYREAKPIGTVAIPSVVQQLIWVGIA